MRGKIRILKCAVFCWLTRSCAGKKTLLHVHAQGGVHVSKRAIFLMYYHFTFYWIKQQGKLWNVHQRRLGHRVTDRRGYPHRQLVLRGGTRRRVGLWPQAQGHDSRGQNGSGNQLQPPLCGQQMPEWGSQLANNRGGERGRGRWGGWGQTTQLGSGSIWQRGS